jgi:hypothetical protein
MPFADSQNDGRMRGTRYAPLKAQALRSAAIDWEANMKRTTAALCALMLLGSANVLAQTNSGQGNVTGAGATQGATQGTKQGIEPGKAADSMNQLGSPQSGASSPQGTLMQKREQGMSAQGEGTKGSSGAVKQ